MKKLLAISGLFVFLCGCQDPISLPKDLKSNLGNEEFVELEASEYTTYLKPIREYMYTRTQAVLNHDVNILWEKYPELKNNIDKDKGINIEKDEIDLMKNVIDANYSIESYEPIKLKKINEQEVIILVHGSISYVKKDFDEAGGEQLIEVYLQKKNDRWTVVKTDVYLEHEYQEWLEKKENNFTYLFFLTFTNALLSTILLFRTKKNTRHIGSLSKRDSVFFYCSNVEGGN